MKGGRVYRWRDVTVGDCGCGWLGYVERNCRLGVVCVWSFGWDCMIWCVIRRFFC